MSLVHVVQGKNISNAMGSYPEFISLNYYGGEYFS